MKTHLLDLKQTPENSEHIEKNYSRPIDPLEFQNLMERQWHVLNKHVIVPTIEEVQENPRSRSAKLRAATRLR